MDPSIKESLEMERRTVKGNINGPTLLIIRDHGSKTLSMGLGNTFGLTVESTQVIGKIT